MRSKIANRGLVLLLLLALVFTTGCGRGQGELPAPTAQIKAAAVDSGKPGKEEEKAPAVVTLSQETLAMPDTGSLLMRASMIDETVYLYAVNNGSIRFYQYSIPDNRISPLDLQYDGQIEGFSARGDGTLCILHTAEDGNYHITCLHTDGTSREITLDPAAAGSGIIYFFEAMDTGFLLVNSGEALALDAEGHLLQSYGKVQHSAQIVRLSGEKAFIVFGGSMNANAPTAVSAPTRLLYIDSALDVTGSTELSGGYTAFFGGVSDSLFTYLSGVIYRYDYFSGELQELVDISLNGVDVPICSIGDGRFFSIERGKPVILSTSSDTESKILTLACYNSDGLIDRAVQAFNRANRGYMISVKDYSKYDEYDRPDAGLNRYATDVISGNVPDIYDLRSFSATQYAAKGLLEDLTPYFEEDTALKLSDILTPVVEQTGYRGGIYSVVPSFSVWCFSGPPSLLPEKITIADLKALLETHTFAELFGPFYTGPELIEDLLIYMRGELYDTETLHCNFVTEDFIYMLELAAGLPLESPQPREPSYVHAYRGEQLFVKQLFSSHMLYSMSFANTLYGGKAIYSGFPTGGGSAPALAPSLQFGMSSTSANKEGVWQFFRFILGESAQEELFSKIYMPTNRAVFDRLLEQDIAGFLERPETLALLDASLQEIRIPGTLNTDTAKVESYALLDRISCNSQYDGAVYDIILNACGPLFNGDQSPAQTAEIIQSRVRIFLSEQYG